MIDIYGFKIQNQIDKDTFYSLLDLISTEKQKRVREFKFFDDAQRCLYGEILARQAICERLNINNNQLRFSTNKYGKPIILEQESLHFNISHSGDWILCAVDSRTIGVDVEIIKELDLDIARRFFSPEEYDDMMNIAINKRIKYFYKLWTLKESYIKAIGKGLAVSLKSFSFKIENGGDIQLYTRIEFRSCSFWQYEIDNKHIVSICFFRKSLKKKYVREISLAEIISSLKI